MGKAKKTLEKAEIQIQIQKPLPEGCSVIVLQHLLESTFAQPYTLLEKPLLGTHNTHSKP